MTSGISVAQYRVQCSWEKGHWRGGPTQVSEGSRVALRREPTCNGSPRRECFVSFLGGERACRLLFLKELTSGVPFASRVGDALVTSGGRGSSAGSLPEGG